MSKRIRAAVLISGRGSNMTALLDAAKAPDFPAEIALVLSNRPDAAGLDVARDRGVPGVGLDHKPFGKDRGAHEQAIASILSDVGVEWVFLAGYMRVLTPFMVRAYAGRMLNIHPSLLPLFPGVDTHKRALNAGVKLHGCSVHYVTEGVDMGPVVAQAAVPVLPGDTEATLSARVLKAEHRLYPLAVKKALGAQATAPDPDDLLISF